MKPLDRDHSILEHIVSYCDQIEQTVERFGDDYSVFQTDPIYRNAVALCILQIGELVGKLSETFRAQHAEQPIRGRCAVQRGAAAAALAQQEPHASNAGGVALDLRVVAHCAGGPVAVAGRVLSVSGMSAAGTCPLSDFNRAVGGYGREGSRTSC